MSVSQITGKRLPKIIVVRHTTPNGRQRYIQAYECVEPGCLRVADRPDGRCSHDTKIHDTGGNRQ